MKITGGNSLIDADFVLKKAGVGADMKVADLGCGASGHFIFPLAKAVGKEGKVYAVDILKSVLEGVNTRARQEKYENIKTVWTDLESYRATKIETGSLDVGLLANTLYQSKNKPAMLRESARMIKKGGRLAVVDWKNMATPLGPPFEKRVNKEELIRGVEKLGLEKREEFNAGDYHFGVVFEKI